MGGDYTRMRFDPLKDGLGILSQQGRVMLEADLNELVEIVDRRFRSETVDVIGRCTVPRDSPEGFKVSFQGGQLVIGAGRLYADGMQAENHGQSLAFDPVLGGEQGTQPIAYTQQPYYPNPAPLPAAGKHLVYAHVFRREQTALEDPDLVDKAVAVDTGVRLQTAWQVKVLGPAQPDLSCSTADGQVTGWSDLTRPSGGRLTTAGKGVAKSKDPCFIPPDGGYRGTENRLYRVEVHDSGGLGAATFKWSRDNGSVAARVLAIDTVGSVLTVDRTGRDGVLRFSTGDWVEVTDDWRELAGEPGVMAKVQVVDDIREQITLVSVGAAGLAGFDPSQPERHTRLRRWDQRGPVLDANNNVVAQVDPSGLVTVPVGGPSLQLEDGIEVTFGTDGVGQFLTGNHWVFAARTADASVEELTSAPPRGILHHYCRLGVADFDARTVADCRVLWPPEFGASCDCTSCVSADSHNSGQFTIQMAIDLVKATGGTVCLGPGVYELRSPGNQPPLSVSGAGSLRIHGQGMKTRLHYPGIGPAIAISASYDVAVEDLMVVTSGGMAGPAPVPNAGIAIQNSARVRIERCTLVQSLLLREWQQLVPIFTNPQATLQLQLGAAITLQGLVAGLAVRGNLILAGFGIAHFIQGREVEAAATSRGLASPGLPGAVMALGPGVYALLADLDVTGNELICPGAGAYLLGSCIFLGQARFSGNTVFGGTVAGLAVMGTVPAPASLDISGNRVVATAGLGIGVAADRVRVQDNDVSRIVTADRPGIVAEPNPLASAPGGRAVRIAGNRVRSAGGLGISLIGALGSAIVDANLVELSGTGGIVVAAASNVQAIGVTGNQVRDVATGAADNLADAVAGIAVVGAAQAEVAGNVVERVGLQGGRGNTYYGISVTSCDASRVAGNHVVDIAPDSFTSECAAIAVLGTFQRCDVVDNFARRRLSLPVDSDRSWWRSILVGIPPRFELAVGSAARYFVVNGRIFHFSGLGLAVLQRGPELVAVRGNLLEAYGSSEQVGVYVAGSCTFAENRCIQSPAVPSAPRVHLMCGALVCSSNYVQSAAGDETLAAELARNGPFTVIGNVTSSVIYLNNAPLAAPWDTLNIVG